MVQWSELFLVFSGLLSALHSHRVRWGTLRTSIKESR